LETLNDFRVAVVTLGAPVACRCNRYTFPDQALAALFPLAGAAKYGAQHSHPFWLRRGG